MHCNFRVKFCEKISIHSRRPDARPTTDFLSKYIFTVFCRHSMNMRLQHIEPTPEIAPYIWKMWIFESSGPLPSDDMKLIVPNGRVKLVVPYKNGLNGTIIGQYNHISTEHQVTLIGICDSPSIVDTVHNAPSGTIGIEFSPVGAYRFFRLRQSELKNKILPLEDVLGKTAAELQQCLGNTPGLRDKVHLLQQFLVRLFRQTPRDEILDFCLQTITAANGSTTVRELEKLTGYSSRWLNMKFDDKVGLSPKSLTSLTRFQYYYQAIAGEKQQVLHQKDFYDHYYDQAHFIKEFRRFTGLSPQRFEQVMNDFGRIFYRR